MLKFAVVEIAGRQYKVSPDQKIMVDYLGDIKQLKCDKVLLRVDDSALSLGKPYLKDSLDFEVLDHKRGPKIRVATYHAKANTRKVKGSRRHTSTVALKGSE